jgi:NAD(P)-dependent dehydrogenase (short-subunit alcohol dehydrogenase family)
MQATPLAEIEESEWRRAIDVNVTGSFLVCKHAIPAMIAAGGGSIILMASQMGRVAYAGSSAYCTTKGALLQLAKGIALDYVSQGIRANTLSPGGIATDRRLLRFRDIETAQREWGGARGIRWGVSASPKRWREPRFSSPRSTRAS